MTNPDPNELLRRLHELEQENKKLRAISKVVLPGQLVVTENEYQGHPVLTFQRGNNRAFNLGVKKLESIKEAWPKVIEFLGKHGDNGVSRESESDHDDQI
jgi:hypothetical protein